MKFFNPYTAKWEWVDRMAGRNPIFRLRLKGYHAGLGWQRAWCSSVSLHHGKSSGSVRQYRTNAAPKISAGFAHKKTDNGFAGWGSNVNTMVTARVISQRPRDAFLWVRYMNNFYFICQHCGGEDFESLDQSKVSGTSPVYVCCDCGHAVTQEDIQKFHHLIHDESISWLAD